jgi:hypothetical protein
VFYDTQASIQIPPHSKIHLFSIPLRWRCAHPTETANEFNFVGGGDGISSVSPATGPARFFVPANNSEKAIPLIFPGAATSSRDVTGNTGHREIL